MRRWHDDRRGRGDSTNTLPYAAEHEYEDLAAVLEAAGSGGSELSIFAHRVSSGGVLVLGAVAAGVPIVRASVLEVPYRIEGAPPEPPDYLGTLSRLGAEGDHEGSVQLFHTQVVGLPEEMLDWMHGTPMWDALLALAPTLVHDVPTATLAPALVSFYRS